MKTFHSYKALTQVICIMGKYVQRVGFHEKNMNLFFISTLSTLYVLGPKGSQIQLGNLRFSQKSGKLKLQLLTLKQVTVSSGLLPNICCSPIDVGTFVLG